MLIAARNAMMVGKSILPPGARWVEYLESTGTQYVNTGRRLTMDSEVYVLWEILSYSRYGECIFGSGTGGDDRYQWLREGPGQTINRVDGWSRTVFYGVSSEARHYVYGTDIDIKNRTLKENGSTISISISTPPSSRNFYLFCSSSDLSNKTKARIHRQWQKENGVLVLDLAPIAIGTTGYMLDLLTGEYEQYGNKGTGSFIIGPDASAPAGGGV